MKKILATSLILATVAISFAFANNATPIEGTDDSSKIPPCRAQFLPCPGGGFYQKCTRNGGIQTPYCDQFELTVCSVIGPCR